MICPLRYGGGCRFDTASSHTCTVYCTRAGILCTSALDENKKANLQPLKMFSMKNIRLNPVCPIGIVTNHTHDVEKKTVDFVRPSYKEHKNEHVSSPKLLYRFSLKVLLGISTKICMMNLILFHIGRISHTFLVTEVEVYRFYNCLRTES
jgi:hypothetical protein